ncbi:MAG TPA: lipopolysaccharide assembly protein LapB, partial [Rubrivivax sp.]|nr:lipopolysaccharide assembly protein LapB [Rubrivivax sp.]
GLFDRAEAAWRALAGTVFDGEAQLALLSLYERSRDWPRALETARQLEAAGGGSFTSRIAHYECELAEEADARAEPGDQQVADAALDRARQAAPHAPRPLLLTGQRLLKRGDAAGAMQAWDALREEQPAAFLLVADDYARAAVACRRTEAAHEALSSALQRLPSIELLQALQALEANDENSRLARLVTQLKQHPTLSVAQLLLQMPPEALTDEAWTALRDTVRASAAPLQRYRCAACGFEAQRYFWQCPGCLNWDSYPTQRIDSL